MLEWSRAVHTEDACDIWSMNEYLRLEFGNASLAGHPRECGVLGWAFCAEKASHFGDVGIYPSCRDALKLECS